MRTRRLKWNEVVTCKDCGYKAWGYEFPIRQRKPHVYIRRRCWECQRKKQRAHHHARRKIDAGYVNRKRHEARTAQRSLRRLVLSHYGLRCAACGENDLAVLCIDHIHNDGANHRRQISKQGKGGNMNWWLVKQGFPSGFQTLCHNCNHAKQVNGGVVPTHRIKRRREHAQGHINTGSVGNVDYSVYAWTGY